MKKIYIYGFSLVELLVVISVFAVLGTVAANSVMSTLKNTRKTDSQITVRENLNYTLSVIERQIRGAQSIVPCPNTSTNSLVYTDQAGVSTNFSCVFPSGDGYVASGSSRLTSENLQVVSCNFSCTHTDTNKPPLVKVVITAEDKTNKNAEGSRVTVQTDITLRNY